MQQVITIGVMGYSKQGFDESEARGCFLNAMAKIKAEYPSAVLKVAAGYSNIGVAAIVYAEARKWGLSTMGIACRKVLNYERFPCEEEIIVGDNWGDESQTFIDTCQVFIRLGGGPQSFQETKMAKWAGKKVYEYDLPISG